MTRLSTCFDALRADNRKAVIPYIVAGDPSREGTVTLMHRLVDAGADIVELGVPFSDPMSEGPVIQKGHERALANGISLRDVLAMVTEFREHNTDTPVVVMGYANPVERMGYASFADACAQAGVDGLITVDLPPEEVKPLNAELTRVSIDNIFLISPTTPEARIKTIVESASGFIYYVAVKGVTGAGHLDTAEVFSYMSKIKAETALPVCVGFGIKDAASASSIASVADGAVVGSALIDIMAQAMADGDTEQTAADHAIALLADIREGVDHVSRGN
ncbi:MAG: tryptophan synthase subunit alpha [Luminiphilus sp.]|nr:tryptophan synthase subunit alpha [Luminiphilus sp.]